MANKQSEHIGQKSQDKTAGTKDPTSSYGIEKEPMDHVEPQSERLPRRDRPTPTSSEDDALRPNQGAVEPMTEGESPQRNDPSSEDSSQGVRGAARELQRTGS